MNWSKERKLKNKEHLKLLSKSKSKQSKLNKPNCWSRDVLKKRGSKRKDNLSQLHRQRQLLLQLKQPNSNAKDNYRLSKKPKKRSSRRSKDLLSSCKGSSNYCNQSKRNKRRLRSSSSWRSKSNSRSSNSRRPYRNNRREKLRMQESRLKLKEWRLSAFVNTK